MDNTSASSKKQKTENVLEETFFRLTKGLPKRELDLIISEANACEEALQTDIELLEQALNGKEDDPDAIEAMLQTPLTPLDQYWTVSSLIGRLRGEIQTPSLLSVQGSNVPEPAKTSEEAEAMLELTSNPIYTKEHETNTELLAVLKKIYQSKHSLVFKKPVSAQEAPGYPERIKFPVDLSLIRRMIVSRHIKSYADLHQYIGMIAYNCVKYNGRETDYGIVARDFEAMADQTIRNAVLNISRSTPKPEGASPTPSADSAPNKEGQITHK